MSEIPHAQAPTEVPDPSEAVLAWLDQAGLGKSRAAREIRVLHILGTAPEEFTLTALARACGDSLPTVQGVLDTIEARGWSQSTRHPADARKRLVQITREGKRVLGNANNPATGSTPKDHEQS